MPDYGRMYRLLFNAITDSLQAMETGEWIKAEQILKEAQIVCEELYLEMDSE